MIKIQQLPVNQDTFNRDFLLIDKLNLDTIPIYTCVKVLQIMDTTWDIFLAHKASRISGSNSTMYHVKGKHAGTLFGLPYHEWQSNMVKSFLYGLNSSHSQLTSLISNNKPFVVSWSFFYLSFFLLLKTTRSRRLPH